MGDDVGIEAWTEQEKAERFARQFDAATAEVLDGRPNWVISARVAVSCYVAFMDDVQALVAAADAENQPACQEILARLDKSLSDVALLVADLPVPGAGSIRAGVDSMAEDFRANSFPDLGLMVEIAKWLDQARSIAEVSTN
ncbi:MAG TPA: hypothetical protein VHU88_03310 [Sporichthyaceae bacterium]|nr:hypothetical protein [Sporichthyaceae bacterium]